MSHQDKLTEEKDEFVESLSLTPEKIREDLEKMRDVEGFPIGDIEDILELSDPPYYTAYPNPYIKDFIDFFGTNYDKKTDNYNIGPFVGDISEGKRDPVYKVHSYHTKVPPKAIIKYIQHYTNPGDIVFDGFCGSGMSGVACQETNRNAILTDISSIATFIAYNYNKPPIPIAEIESIFSEVQKKFKWMYETKHETGEIGTINYVVWSHIYRCPYCSKEFPIWDVAVRFDEKKILKEYICPGCDSKLKNSLIERVKENFLNKNDILSIKNKAVMIDYSVNKKKYRKSPDTNDLKLIEKINSMEIPYWFPINELPEGVKSNEPRKSFGIFFIDQFYTKRNLHVLSAFYDRIKNEDSMIKFIFTSFLQNHPSRQNRWLIDRNHPKGTTCGPLSNTLHIPNLESEVNIFNPLKKAINKYKKAYDLWSRSNSIISLQSSTHLKNIPTNSIDYIFLDPPFGENIMYSELNYILESWLKVLTNNTKEAIKNTSQKKELIDYHDLILGAFNEFFRILKPDRWITIEFHSPKAEIWKIIQKSIISSGFMVAQVAILDKKQGTINQDRNIENAVKNDLIINAYKPSESFTKHFIKSTGLNKELEFLKIHINKLPVDQNIERTHQRLYSKLLALYIQNGFEIRMDAYEFYELIRKNFEDRDGYWFNKEQILEYDKKFKLKDKLADEDINQAILGVSNEKSAIIWLVQFLKIPKTYDEIFIEFSKNLLTSNDKFPELKNILDENFVTENGKYRLPSDIERIEKEEIREKHLMKEFNEIIEEAESKKKIKEVRKEALIHGLIKLYEKKEVDEIKFLGERLDHNIIDSDDDISAIIDWAKYN